jgi:hypothetical protein
MGKVMPVQELRVEPAITLFIRPRPGPREELYSLQDDGVAPVDPDPVFQAVGWIRQHEIDLG